MKSYEEMAKSVLDKRDEYEKSKKQHKKLNVALALSSSVILLGIAVLSVGVGIWLSNSPSSDSPKWSNRLQGGADESRNDASATTNTSSESSQPDSSEEASSASSSDKTSSTISSNNSDNPTYTIDSFDKLNFYAGLLAIKRGMSGVVAGNFAETFYTPEEPPTGDPFNDPWITHSLLPDFSKSRFEVYKAYYLKLNITEPDNFIAEKVGTGVIETVITDNSFGLVITFKNGENYYTLSGKPFNSEYYSDAISFNSRSYIEDGYSFTNWHTYPHNIVLKISRGIVTEARFDYNYGVSEKADDAFTPADIVSGSQRGAQALIRVNYTELEKAMPVVVE